MPVLVYNFKQKLGVIYMELKLAKINEETEAKTISLDTLLEDSLNGGFYYLDREIKEKDLQKLLKTLEDKKRRALVNRVAFGLDEKDFVYELHIV